MGKAELLKYRTVGHLCEGAWFLFLGSPVLCCLINCPSASYYTHPLVTFEFDFHHLMNVFQNISIGLEGVTWAMNADFQA